MVFIEMEGMAIAWLLLIIIAIPSNKFKFEIRSGVLSNGQSSWFSIRMCRVRALPLPLFFE